MARPFPFDGNHASQKFDRLMGVILLGLAALGMGEANAQAKLEQTDVAIAAAGMTVGATNVDPACAPITGGEDFAFMLQKKPGAYIMIGNGGTGEGGCQNVHSPLYDFSDEILTTGATWSASSSGRPTSCLLYTSPSPRD